jgi:Zn ribbon nucleic-acid-binding protein
MSIRNEEGYLFACNNCIYPPKQIRKLKDRRTYYGLLFCPQCLKEDKIPYFRKQWRYTFYNACSKHKVFLADRCGVCYERVRLSKMRFNGSIVHCSKCGNDLRKTRTRKVPGDYNYSLDAIRWFEEGLKNGYFVINGEKIHSLWIFQSYTRLSLLLDRKEELVLDGFSMLAEYKSLCKKLDHYNSKKCGPIYKNFFACAMIYHLFQNFPDNLISFAKSNDLTHRDFVHEFKDVPFWYKEEIDKYIPVENTIGREITKSEVIAAIEYLKKLNVNVTQEKVAGVLGCHPSINKSYKKLYKSICYSDI